MKDELARLAAPQRDALREARHHAQREVAAAFAEEAPELVAHAQEAQAGDAGASLVPVVTTEPQAEPDAQREAAVASVAEADGAHQAPTLDAESPAAGPTTSASKGSASSPDDPPNRPPPKKGGAPDVQHRFDPRTPNRPGGSRRRITSATTAHPKQRRRHGSDPPD